MFGDTNTGMMMPAGMDGYMEGMGSENWGQQSYSQKPLKPGDWFCPNCGDHQFARNMCCRKCGAANPVNAGGAGGVQQWQMIAGAGGGMGGVDGGCGVYGGCDGKGRRQLPGDWVCPNCGDYQFAKNAVCRKCQTPNPNPDPMQQALAAGMGPGKGSAKPLKPGDWMCPSCGDHQFARNQVCRRCSTPNPNPSSPADTMSGTGHQMKPGDWVCPACGDLQFARNAQCRKCGAGNPDPSSMTSQNQMKPGDWNCPNCGDHQFARNQQCRRCGTPNPNPGNGMVAWGGDGGSGGKGWGKGWDGDGGKGGKGWGKGWDGDGCGMAVQHGMGMGQTWGAGFQKGYAPMKGGKGQMMSKGDQEGKPTSWKCPNCAELVFARNSECKSCGTPRPADDGSSRSAPY